MDEVSELAIAKQSLAAIIVALDGFPAHLFAVSPGGAAPFLALLLQAMISMEAI
jgi:hypothetical protein